MRNLFLCNILYILVAFSASEQIFPTTAALYTHKQPHTQNIIDTKSKQHLSKIFLFHATAIARIREFHFCRVIKNNTTFRDIVFDPIVKLDPWFYQAWGWDLKDILETSYHSCNITLRHLYKELHHQYRRGESTRSHNWSYKSTPESLHDEKGKHNSGILFLLSFIHLH